MKTPPSATGAVSLRGFTAPGFFVLLGIAASCWAATPPSPGSQGVDSLIGASLANPPAESVSPLPGTTAGIAASAHLKGALAYYEAGDYARAATSAEAVATTVPNSSHAYLLIGASRLKLGQFEAGIAALQTAIRLAPQNLEPISALAHAFLGKGQLGEARKYFSLVLEQRADHPGAHDGLGRISEREGKFQEAAAHFEAATKDLPPNALGAKLNLAANYNRLRQFDKTIALLSTPVAEAKPADGSAVEMLAIAYLGSGKAAEAIKVYERAYASAPSAPIAMGLGMSYRAINRLPESLKFLREATASRANWSAAWVQLAETQIALSDFSGALGSLQKGKAFATAAEATAVDLRTGDVHLLLKDYPKAIAIFERLAANKEADWAIFDRLGSAYQMTGDTAAAERTYKKAGTQFPASPLPPYKLGMLYSSLDRHRDAIAAFSSAASLDPDSLGVQRALINAHAKAGEGRRAIEIAEALVKKQPASVEPKLFLAALYSQASDDRRATEIYREILKTTPDHPLALNNLAMTLGRRGEFEEAIHLSQRAVALLPRSGQILDTLGWLKYQKGDFAEAVGLLKKSAELSPEDASIFYHLGMAYSKQNEKTAALAAFKRAVSLSKVFAEYQQATQMIASLGGGS